MGLCARKVPLTCKTTIMDPNGSIIAVLQVEGRFFRRFLANILIAVLQVEGRFFSFFGFGGLFCFYGGRGGWGMYLNDKNIILQGRYL